MVPESMAHRLPDSFDFIRGALVERGFEEELLTNRDAHIKILIEP